MSTSETLDDPNLPWGTSAAEAAPVWTLAVCWSLDEPHRLGESAEINADSRLGREDPSLRFRRWRPGLSDPGAPLTSPRISRAQLELSPGARGLGVKNVGRAPLLVNDVERAEAVVQPGDTLTLRNTLVLVVGSRAPWVDLPGASLDRSFPFGRADADGIVGESSAAWRLRAELAFAAAHGHHVLLRGPSGVGKELAARAIHARSRRGGRPLVARNAATFPEGLVDAELFGTAKNYPQTGSPERPGLVGEADGTSLFLDEIGELPPALQAHLLRVLDAGGEYQRLGESRLRRSDLRLIAATNRPVDALKHDFAARLTARVEIPGLEARREDIPLLLRAILERAGTEMPALRARFFDGEARVHPQLVDALVRHPYTHHARELTRLAWLALTTSPSDHVALTPEVAGELRAPAEPRAEVLPDREAVEAAMAAAGGRPSVAAEQLGLRNRFVLYRLLKKYGLAGGEG